MQRLEQQPGACAAHDSAAKQRAAAFVARDCAAKQQAAAFVPHLDSDLLAAPLALVHGTKATDADLLAIRHPERLRSGRHVAVGVVLPPSDLLVLRLQALELVEAHAELRGDADD